MAELYRYAAFISYSSKDAAFAKRLHRALESYGIPSSLGKFDLINGGKQNRIYPVFRDREELAAGHLGEVIEANLRASAALIVVCSPNAAASPWVQKEIEYFAGLGRSTKIFAIVADDAPIVDASGADATAACFPPAFRGDALAGDKLEPLAADARKGKDGFRGAWLKLVAGLIGVTPGQIIDRDKKRTAQQRSIAAAALATITVGISALAAILSSAAWRDALLNEAMTLADTGDVVHARTLAIGGNPNRGDFVITRSARAANALERLASFQRSEDLGQIFSFDWSRDGGVRVLYRTDGQVLLQDHSRSAVNLGLRSQRVSTSALSRDGRVFVAQELNNSVHVYASAQAWRDRTLGRLTRFKLAQDGSALLGIDATGTGWLFDLNSNAPSRDLGKIRAFDFSADATSFALQRQDGRLALYRVSNTTQPVAQTQASWPAQLRDFILSRTGQVLFVRDHASARGYVIDFAHGAQSTPLGVLADYAVSPNNDWLVAEAAIDGNFFARLYNLAGDVSSTDLGEPGSYQFFGGGAFLLFQTSLGEAVAYDLTRWRSARRLGSFAKLAAAQDAPLVFGVTPEGVGSITDLRSATVVSLADRFPNPDNLDIRLSANGSALLTRSHESNDAAHPTGVWTLYTTRRWTRAARGDLGNIRRLHGGPLETLIDADSNGRRLIVVNADSAGSIYDLQSPNSRTRTSASEVCDTETQSLRPFSRAVRHAHSPASNALRGRPWNPCDWRGLAAILPNPQRGDAWFEGPRQWWRLRMVRWGLAGDYACGEATHGADSATIAARSRACRLEDAES